MTANSFLYHFLRASMITSLKQDLLSQMGSGLGELWYEFVSFASDFLQVFRHDFHLSGFIHYMQLLHTLGMSHMYHIYHLFHSNFH